MTKITTQLRSKVKFMIPVVALSFSIFASACGPKEISTTPKPEESVPVETLSSIKPEVQAPKEENHLKLKENFIKKAITTYKALPYQGYVKVIKDGNLVKFVYMNEVVNDRDIDIKLHTQSLWMDLENKEISNTNQTQLPSDDIENIDLNNNKFNIIFSGKCPSEYTAEVVKDIEQYAAYDYFKITKEGYKVDVVFGGREYDKIRKQIEEKYYRLVYRLNIDSKCEKAILNPQEKIAKPVATPISTPTPSAS